MVSKLSNISPLAGQGPVRKATAGNFAVVSPADFDTDTLGKPLTATAGRDAAEGHVEEQSGPAAMCTGRKDGCWPLAWYRRMHAESHGVGASNWLGNLVQTVSRPGPLSHLSVFFLNNLPSGLRSRISILVNSPPRRLTIARSLLRLCNFKSNLISVMSTGTLHVLVIDV